MRLEASFVGPFNWGGFTVMEPNFGPRTHPTSAAKSDGVSCFFATELSDTLRLPIE
jgi:hypothetical protein